MSATAGHPAVSEQAIRCPRCHAPVLPEQDWCLTCGAPARTRLAPTPNWRAPIVALGVVAAVSLVALVLAFFALTSDDDHPSSSSTPTGQTGPSGPAATP